jgi:uncharacterized protein DUF3455
MHPAKSITVVLLFTACAASAAHMAAPDVPPAVAVPAGHKPSMTLTGVGQLTYECRAKADASGAHEWVFVGPDATLKDAAGKPVGKYYAGPTWEHNDGGRITGKQLAVAPGATGAIPLQLVQTASAMAPGAFDGVTYIQRVNTMGGIAPAAACDASTAGRRQVVNYSADYVFYKP